MRSLAKVTVRGTLAEDPVARIMESGRKLVGLSVFTEQTRCDTEPYDRLWVKGWHRIVIVNQRLAAAAEAELVKGDQVYLEGELHTRHWPNRGPEGQPLTEIHLEDHGGKLIRIADASGGVENAIHGFAKRELHSVAHMAWSEKNKKMMELRQ